MNIKTNHVSSFNSSFFEKVAPIKLTEARNLKLFTDSWGLLTDYYLESVKVTPEKSGEIISSATIRIGDSSGQITCLIRGPTIGLLFGLSRQSWIELESLSKRDGQLFYRYFKNGMNNSFSYEKKLFYYFCASNQKKDILVAVFRRTTNMRQRDKNDAFLQISELRKLDTSMMDLYQSYIQRELQNTGPGICI